MTLILASSSARRRELLTRAGYTFTVRCADVDETLAPGVSPAQGVGILALRKGRAAATGLAADHPPLLAADTLVDLAGTALGKPRDEQDACRMLRALAGRTHFVHTGMALLWQGKEDVFTDTAAVTFRPLSEEQIHAYIRTGEPMDKAGAYGIQGMGGALVEKVEGDFDTVVGLCTRALRMHLQALLAQGNSHV